MQPRLWLLQCEEQRLFLRKGKDGVSSQSASSGSSILLDRAGRENCEAIETFDDLRKGTLERCGREIKSSPQ